MAFVLADRVRETTTTAGTGAVSLAGAVSGFQTFSVAIGDANNTYYTIADPTTGAWEVGIGTYTSSGNTLSRDTVLSSSNSGSLVNFASNSKDVFVTQPASRAVFVQNAGTGLQTGTTAFTANRVIYSNATNTTTTSASLTFDGTTLTSAAFSGPLNGTVGATTPNTGAFTSIVSTSALGILTRAAANQDGVVLLGRSGGTGSFEVALTPTTLTTDRTLTLPDNSGTVLTTGAVVTVPQGGTGLTSGTSGGVPYFSSTTAITSSAVLAANALVVGGGAGAAPATITTGTGVVTALGVNTGTAGAFVVNGGALGTPSSGTVTNLTGTASININGTVGATTPNTGAFTSVTSVSASGILTRAAATQDGVQLLGRAGGTSSYEVTLTPTTLTADRTLTLPDVTTTVVGTDATQTLTNKRVNPRAVAAGATSGNLTPNGDTTDVFNAFGLTGAITMLTPSGTPVDGQRLMLRFEDNGTGRGITWTTTSGAFRAVGITLPTTTVASKVTYVGCVYNSTDVFWDVVATVTQA